MSNERFASIWDAIEDTMNRAFFLAAAIVLPTMANAQAAPEHHVWQDKRIFEPMSRTAQSITGSIRLSGNPYFAEPGSKMRMTFGNGASVSLTAVGASWRHWDDSSDQNVTAEVFQIDHDPGPLENGNTLCGDPKREPARYAVFHEGYLMGDIQLLSLAVFGSKKPPRDINSPGLCGTFNFYVE